MNGIIQTEEKQKMKLIKRNYLQDMIDVMGTPNTKHEEYQYEGIRIINLKDWLVQKVNTYTYYIYNIQIVG